MNVAQNTFLFLSIFFIIFARPSWCVEKGSKINYMCTKSLDPENPVTYSMTDIPLLNNTTKMSICMISMLLVLGIMLLKLKVTKSSPFNRKVFYFCFLDTVLYGLVYFLSLFDIYEVPCSDLLPLFFIIFNVRSI